MYRKIHRTGVGDRGYLNPNERGTGQAASKRWVSSEAMLVPWTLSTVLVSSIASVAVGFSASASLGVVAKHGEPRARVVKYVIHDASR